MTTPIRSSAFVTRREILNYFYKQSNLGEKKKSRFHRLDWQKRDVAFINVLDCRDMRNVLMNSRERGGRPFFTFPGL
jgi:hypothetical protein